MSGEKEIRIDVVKLALATQLAVFGLIGLDKIGVNVQILRQTLVFFYLAFLPGMLILRLRNMYLSPTKAFLLSFGISLAFVTLLFTFVDVFLASAGVERPISEIPLFISISIAVLLLIVVCHFKGEPQISLSCNPHLFFSPLFLLLLLFPLASILASYTSAIKGNDISVLFLLAVIALIPLIVSLDKFPERYCPLLILSSSISLTFLRFGGFIFKAYSLCETGIAGVIKTVGIWIPNFACTHNSLLYLTIFHPAFSILSGIDINHEVRIAGFLIVSFLPLIVYEIYIKFFDRRTSAFASFLFMFYPFHNELLGGRTGFAVYFLALLLLTWFSKEINPVLRKALLILFAFSIIASHYGTSYYFMILLFVAAIIAFLISTSGRIKIPLFSSLSAFCILYFVFAFSWYIYTSASANMNWAVGFGKNVYMHLSEFLSPESSATIQAVITQWEFSQEVAKYLLFANTFFIAIGILKLIYDFLKGRKFLSEYDNFALAFSLGLFVLLLPRIMGTVRIYAVSLLLLSPFSFIGFSLLLNKFSQAVRTTKGNRHANFFSVFLLLLLLFGSGFISNIEKKVTNTPFDPNEPINWWPIHNQQDIEATEWLLSRHVGGKLYVDEILGHRMYVKGGAFTEGSFNFPLVYAGREVYNMKPIKVSSLKDYLEKDDQVSHGYYLYLGYHNTVYNFIGTINETGERVPLKTSDYLYLFERGNRIYDNGISLIYWR